MIKKRKKTESFSRKYWFLGHSKSSQHFMDIDASVSWSQQASTFLYPDSDKFILHSHILFIFVLLFRVHWVPSSDLLPSDFPSKTSCPIFSSPVCVISPAYLVFPDFITLTTFGKGYKFWSSSLHRHLQLPIISSISGPNILLRNLFRNITSLRFPLLQDKFQTHTKLQTILNFCIRRSSCFTVTYEMTKFSAQNSSKYSSSLLLH